MKMAANSEFSNKKKCAARYVQQILNAMGKRTCHSMAKDLIRSHDSIQRDLGVIADNPEIIMSDMVGEAITRNRKKRGYLIVDSTLLKKFYAKKMEGVSLQYSGSEISLGISLTVVLFVNGDGIIVVGSFVWQKGDQSRVKTATELAISLAQKIGCDYVLKDGAFVSLEALLAYENSGTQYVMRMHSNRVVCIDGLTTNVKNHFAFKMRRNQRQIVRDAEWHGLKIRIVAIKLSHKSKGSITIFLVTNMSFKKAKNAGSCYKNRWKIETFFRAVKQNFGINDCGARSLRVQHAHCIAVFAAHRQFQEKPVITTKKRPPQRILRIKMQISRISMCRLPHPIESSHHYA